MIDKRWAWPRVTDRLGIEDADWSLRFNPRLDPDVSVIGDVTGSPTSWEAEPRVTDR